MEVGPSGKNHTMTDAGRQGQARGSAEAGANRWPPRSGLRTTSRLGQKELEPQYTQSGSLPAAVSRAGGLLSFIGADALGRVTSPRTMDLYDRAKGRLPQDEVHRISADGVAPAHRLARSVQFTTIRAVGYNAGK
jgi:hypothetical protein